MPSLLRFYDSLQHLLTGLTVSPAFPHNLANLLSIIYFHCDIWFWAPQSDCLVSYRWGWIWVLCRDAVSVFYSPIWLEWYICVDASLCIWVCMRIGVANRYIYVCWAWAYLYVCVQYRWRICMYVSWGWIIISNANTESLNELETLADFDWWWKLKEKDFSMGSNGLVFF